MTKFLGAKLRDAALRHRLYTIGDERASPDFNFWVIGILYRRRDRCSTLALRQSPAFDAYGVGIDPRFRLQ